MALDAQDRRGTLSSTDVVDVARLGDKSLGRCEGADGAA